MQKHSKSALIGYTGFIGTNLKEQFFFTDFYNSKNIEDIKNKSYDIVFSSANSGHKWLVNKNHISDRKNIENYIEIIKTVNTKKFVLISSIDIYPYPYMVSEDNIVNSNNISMYGSNRLLMEQFVQNHFVDYLIVRVPIIYGKHFKKNIIFDLINKHEIEKINPDSIIQFYNVKNIKYHIEKALHLNLKIINLATEPISSKSLANFFDIDISKNKKSFPFRYDMYSNNVYEITGKNSNYLQTTEELLAELNEFKKIYQHDNS
jgi:hypothetical protein